MNHNELLAMAVFRMHEAAKHLELLARHSQTPAMASWLRSVAAMLDAHALQGPSHREAAEPASDAQPVPTHDLNEPAGR